MGSTNRYVKMYRTKNLPMVVSQSIWFEGETKFADVILTGLHHFERWDVSDVGEQLRLQPRQTTTRPTTGSSCCRSSASSARRSP
jgi:anaerobic selenocysteine-containing dehydrogenase